MSCRTRTIHCLTCASQKFSVTGFAISLIPRGYKTDKFAVGYFPRREERKLRNWADKGSACFRPTMRGHSVPMPPLYTASKYQRVNSHRSFTLRFLLVRRPGFLVACQNSVLLLEAVPLHCNCNLACIPWLG